MAYRRILRCLATVGAALFLATAPSLTADRASAASSPSVREATRSSPEGAESEVDALETEVDELDRFVDRLFLLLSILVGLLAAGGLVGLITSVLFERRQAQLHRLAVAGETAAQERAVDTHGKFLKGSQQTLTLVNDTLALAKDASKRAEDAVRGKAVERLRDLDKEAEELLEAVHHAADFKYAVRDPWTEEQLRRIAERFSGFDEFAENEPPELAPHCMFAKGVDRHLKGLPEPAIASWRRAAAAEGKHELAALALFWVGYEQSNIGQFDDAAITYGEAWERHLKDESRAQHYELKRSQIQARFFELASEVAEEGGGALDRRAAAQEFIDELDTLIDSLGSSRKALRKERAECNATAGELLVWSARISPLERPSGESLSDGERQSLEEAVGRFEQAGDKVWARFGRAQAKWKLDDGRGKLAEPEYHDLLQSLLDETGSHREKRALALRHAAILIMEGEHHDGEEKLDRAYRDLCNDVGRIGGMLTIFSPWQKRNVPLSVFKQEAAAFRMHASG
jgi:tetratricopeptide (TPR) repeat protein